MENWGKIKAYIDLAMENVQTDLEVGSVVWFAANVLGLNKGTPALKMENVETYTLPGNYNASTYSRAVGNNQSYVTINPKEVVELVNEHFNPYEQRVTTSMLDAMSIRSNGDIASSTGSLRDGQHNGIMAVQRGEAYYDDEGNLVYGAPPVTPEQDEEGNVVYTDEEGQPLTTGEPTLPGEEGQPGDPINLPADPVDGGGNTRDPLLPEGGGPGGEDNPGEGADPDQTAGPGQTENPDQTGNPGEGTAPVDTPADVPPELPEEPDVPSFEDEPPGWL